jgi:RimJ/RimL family protein N-acetyltransferase
MPGPMFAAGNSVTLRPIEEADLEFLAAARNDPAIRRPLTVNRPSNGEQTRDFFEDAISTDDGVNLLIAADEEPVGMVSLFDEDDIAGTATVAYWVVPDEQGNGYCTEGVGLLCEHAFGDRRLNKLRADVLATNDGSRRVLEKLGFAEEGLLREEKFVYGDYVDVHRFGLLADDWEEV